MNDKRENSAMEVDGAAPDSEELRELRAAEQRARALREKAIAREQARLRAVAVALDVSPEELCGLPARKRRRKSENETQ